MKEEERERAGSPAWDQGGMEGVALYGFSGNDGLSMSDSWQPLEKPPPAVLYKDRDLIAQEDKNHM